MTTWWTNALELERLRADRKEALELLGLLILDPERHVALTHRFGITPAAPDPTSTCLECEEPWPCPTERAAQLLDRCQQRA